MSAAAASEKSGYYYLMGHGLEQEELVFEKRNTIPAGTVLITLAECGAVSLREDEIIKSIKYFSHPSVLPLLDALKSDDLTIVNAAIQEIIKGYGKTIHVYRPGDLYPNITFIPYDPQIYSGVMRLPLNSGSLLSNNSSSVRHGITNEIRYSKSIFPTNVDSIEVLTIKTLMEKFGDGVYIYPNCREISGEYNKLYKALVQKIREIEEYEETGILRNIYRYPRNLEHAAEIYNTMSNGKLPYKISQFISNLHSPIRLVREKSWIQQDKYKPAGGAGMGGARRTHRRRGSRQKTKRLPKRHA